jgi:type I restriction enzyme S subunit
MSENDKHPLVPRLRFPEFEGAVSALPLAAVADLVSERISVEQITSAQYVSTENLLPDFGGMNPAIKLPSISSVTSFRPNDVLVSNIRPYLRKVWQANICGGASNDVLVVRPAERVGADYLAAILRSDLFIDYVMRGAKGVKMPRGEISMIQEFPVPCPSADEQQKIADCLSSLDDLITAENQKLDALQTHKKSLMQQLVPRDGETVPRLRFPEFWDAGEWEEHALGSKVTKVGSGITPTGGEKIYKKSGRPFVRSQNVGWGVLLLDDVAFIDEETHQSFSGTEISHFDVLLNITGASIGRSVVADSRIAGGNVNQHVCIIRTTDELRKR